MRGVRKAYGQGHAIVLAVRNVSFDLRQGEFVAVAGRSGSGKSTLLHLVGGLDSPDAGSIELAGQDLSRLSARQLAAVRRRDVGFVFQSFNLIPTLTTGENVALPLLLDGISGRDARIRVERMLDLVGLAHRLDHSADHLSGGEMQRTAVARALVTMPSLLLADEPTGSLDSETGDQVLALIAEMRRRLDLTVLMVTHDQRAAESADRVLEMQDGSIATPRTRQSESASTSGSTALGSGYALHCSIA